MPRWLLRRLASSRRRTGVRRSSLTRVARVGDSARRMLRAALGDVEDGGEPAVLVRLARGYQRRCFAWLFVSLLLTLAVGSTLDELAPRWNPLEVLLALNLLASLASVAHERTMRGPLILGGVFVVTRILLTGLGVPGMLGFSQGLWIVIIAVTMVTSVRHAFRAGGVDAERILAALDAYLLTGLLFGVAYALLEQTWPGSLSGVPTGALHLPRSIYFSFVTLATLGYGDVVPVSEPARGLAIVEGLGGQLYLTVLVARLVALYSQQRHD
jgi:voltage-gated potassium channel